jgi:DNA polymerase elongation subunit (family B)/predicted RNA-binding Zn-ribbon protein involved in translation (DUF1610 family)
MKKEPNIILFDLETLMNMQEIAKIFPSIGNYPGRTMKATITSIICFGYKKLGDKKAKCINAWDFPKRWKIDKNDDYEVVKAAYEILNKADAVVTHNGIKFDMRHLNTRLVANGFPPLHNIPHIDTVRLARKNLLLYSNRLDDVATFLGVENKLENGGWQLWVDVLNNKKKAMKLMSKYCKQDVEVLEQVYKKLMPLAKNIPNHNLFKGKDSHVCPSCGSHKIQKNGFVRTKTTTKQRYRCLSCGSSSSVSVKGTLPRSV